MLLNDEEGPSLPDTDNVAAVARDTPKYAHTSKPHVSALDRHVYNLTTSYNPDPIIHSTFNMILLMMKTHFYILKNLLLLLLSLL